VQDLEETRKKLKHKNRDVENRDEAIGQLESILERATSRYATKMEEERLRLETNNDVEIQTRPHVADFQQQVNFVLSSTTITNMQKSEKCKSNHSLIKPDISSVAAIKQFYGFDGFHAQREESK